MHKAQKCILWGTEADESTPAGVFIFYDACTPQVLWDVATGSAICGSPTNSNFTNVVKFFQNRSDKLMTGGNYNLHVWEYDRCAA